MVGLFISYGGNGFDSFLKTGIEYSLEIIFIIFD
jgi:hypothetical protein